MLGLSDRARMQLVVAALLVLGGGGVYKLVTSIQRLNEPLPAASPNELIKPMEQLFRDTKKNMSSYQQTRLRETPRLDSLTSPYTKNTTP